MPAAPKSAIFGAAEGQAIVDRLRNDWLLELGRKRDWATFDEQLPLFVLNDDVQVKCYALQSRALKGHKVASDAREVLTAPNGYGEPCALIATLYAAGQFNERPVCTVRLSGEYNATGQARHRRPPERQREARRAGRICQPLP
jgi:soluble lytic murein transglycosylase